MVVAVPSATVIAPEPGARAATQEEGGRWQPEIAAETPHIAFKA